MAAEKKCCGVPIPSLTRYSPPPGTSGASLATALRAPSAAAARARHDPRAVEAALHGAPDELVVREVGGRRGVHARQLEVERRHRAAARREDGEGEEEQEH